MKCPCLWDEYKLSQRMCKNKTIVPAQQKKVYFNFSGSPTKLIPLSKEEGEKNTRVNFFFCSLMGGAPRQSGWLPQEKNPRSRLAMRILEVCPLHLDALPFCLNEGCL